MDLTLRRVPVVPVPWRAIAVALLILALIATALVVGSQRRLPPPFGVARNGGLVFAKGYGYRDWEKKLPFTPATCCPIASNSKLFTAVAAGLLVDEGKLTWDRPIRESVPSVEFYDENLNANVTLRDMLAHRTGITRHDLIWYKSDFSRQDLFERLKYLEPKEPMRQTFLYNNLMYAATGYLIELKTGKIARNQRADGSFDNNNGWAAVISQGLCNKALNLASRTLSWLMRSIVCSSRA